ncbi:hypothetical protein M885DRAFT_224700 [Pelagophyceae sp. CCMP2097]|nr:hypothetical protein M885DRAFT_224700 [Pelagophyceae sp. CCMP2097]
MYVGAPVGQTLTMCLWAMSLRESARVDRFAAEFESAVHVFEQQLAQLDAAAESERRLRVEERAALQRRCQVEAETFVRHEVKNGLLDALGDLEALQQQLAREAPLPPAPRRPPSPSPNQGPGPRERRRSASASAGDDFVHGGPRAPAFPDLHAVARPASAAQQLEQVLSLASTLSTVAATLQDTLDTVLSSAVVSDVLAGTYVPMRRAVDVIDVACAAKPSALVTALQATPLSLSVPTDSKILRFILVNALSNAGKYGARGEPVQLHAEAFPASEKQRVVIRVTNKAGEGHARLVAHPDPAAIFESGVRLHDNPDEGVNGDAVGKARSMSAGQGAWIMQRCAAVLGGQCAIRFEHDHTVFTLTFDAPLAADPPRLSGKGLARQASVLAPPDGKLPRPWAPPFETLFVVLEDSPSQRRLLVRYLAKLSAAAGKDDRTMVFGDSPNCVENFVPHVVDRLLRAAPTVHLVALLDDHLKLDDSVRTVVVSGINLGVELRAAMAAAGLEHRALLIARSGEAQRHVPRGRMLAPESSARAVRYLALGNEDPGDCAVYLSKLHGAVPKSCSFDHFCMMIRDLYEARFADAPEPQELPRI